MSDKALAVGCLALPDRRLAPCRSGARARFSPGERRGASRRLPGATGAGVSPLRRARVPARRSDNAITVALDRFRTSLAGADPDAIVHRQNEDLAVARLAAVFASHGLLDRLDGWVDEGIVHGDLQLHLGQ